MTVFVDDPDFQLHVGDAIDVLRTLPDESVHCVVTSPPYWGLRDYGTGSWAGGDPDCDHDQRRRERDPDSKSATNSGSSRDGVAGREACRKCGATRTDQQLGLEPTPEAYVARMVEVFREVRRVLRRDGTCWLNIGDSYAGHNAPGWRPGNEPKNQGVSNKNGVGYVEGHKPKDLVGIPWRLAFALQQPYYAGRIKDERDRLWLAAMLDTEGSIGINLQRGGDHRPNDVYSVSVKVHNCSERLIRRCAEIAGIGTVALAEERNRPVFVWSLYGANARALLRELYPHLVAKQHEARLAFAHDEGTGEAAFERYAALRELHGGRETTVDAVAPPSCLEPGWFLRSDIIWSKPNPMPESVTDRPTKSHEYLFLLTRSARYFYDADAIREPYTYGDDGRLAFTGQTGDNGRRGASAKGPDGRRVTAVIGKDGSEQHRNGERWPNLAGRNARSVWEIATQPYAEAHFATFPEELPRRCIAAGCPMDGTVLDPFMGSGTVALVARKLGRRSIGIELNPEYAGLAARRLQQQSLFA